MRIATRGLQRVERAEEREWLRSRRPPVPAPPTTTRRARDTVRDGQHHIPGRRRLQRLRLEDGEHQRRRHDLAQTQRSTRSGERLDHQRRLGDVHVQLSETPSTFECQSTGRDSASCTSPATYGESRHPARTHSRCGRRTSRQHRRDPASRTFTVTDAGIATATARRRLSALSPVKQTTSRSPAAAGCPT